MSKHRGPRPEALAFDPEPVPNELRDRDQWICWRYGWDDDRDEWTKKPIDPSTGRVDSATDPDTWTSFAEAVAYHDRDDTDTDGLGFALHDDDLFVALDLDDCQDPDSDDVEAWAADVTDDVPTYAEVSPTGTGRHLWGFGIMPDAGNRADVDGADGHLEMYDTGRYVTVTGQQIDGTPDDVRQVNDEIRAVHAEYIAADDADGQPATNGGVEARSTDANPGADAGNADLDDDELLDRAKNAANGDKFQRLWNGDTSGYPSHSEADQALVNLLAFWTGGDRDRIDRLFRRSGLCRDKWTEREDYRRMTIDTALNGVSDVYDPDRDNAGDVPDDLPDSFTPPQDADSDGADGDGEDDRGLADRPNLWELGDGDKETVAWLGANEIAEQDTVVYVEEEDQLYSFDPDTGVWNPDGEQAIRAHLRRRLESNYSQALRREVADQVKALQAVDRADLGPPPGTLPVGNGLLDLDTRELRDLRPEDRCLWRLPVDYDPDADCPRFREFLGDVCPGEDIPQLQEFVGYTLHHWDVPHKKALMLFGPTDAGKSVFLDVIRALFGDTVASQSIQYLTNERWGAARLVGSPVNIRHDLDTGVIENQGKAKELIAGNAIDAERKNKPLFTFEPTTKHIFSANRAPQRDTDDDSFWNRWLTIVFPESIPRDEQDPHLTDTLTQPDELSGVLNWALDGYDRLREQGRFTNEPLPWQNQQKWQRYGDSFDQFFDAYMDTDPDAQVPKWDAYESYKQFATENRMEVISDRKFTKEMKQQNGVSYRQRRVGGRGRPRCYVGVGLTDDAPQPPQDDGDDQDDDDGDDDAAPTSLNDY